MNRGAGWTGGGGRKSLTTSFALKTFSIIRMEIAGSVFDETSSACTHAPNFRFDHFPIARLRLGNRVERGDITNDPINRSLVFEICV